MAHHSTGFPLMLLTQDSNDARYLVTAYEPGRIEINKQSWHCPVLLTSTSMQTEGLPTNATEIQVRDIEPWLASEAEIILLGTGGRSGTPPMALLKAAAKAGKMLEVMDTRAACHTFVVLTSERRKVMAVLFP